MTVLWYVTRGTGVVALLLLTATVVLGIAGTARFEAPRWPRIMTAGLHRHLSLLAVAFVAVHVVTTVLDPFAPIGWTAAVVPFTSSYRPLWLGLGAVAFDLLLAVLVTSLLRARLGYRTWRAVHWLSYASWPVALWHGLGTGTDSRQPLMLALDAGCVAAVACVVGWRISLLPSARGRLTACSAGIALALATASFVVLGPLQSSWARRAGTPVALLAGATGAASTAGSAGAGGTPGAVGGQPGSGRLTGRVSRTGPGADGEATITVSGQIGSSPRQSIVITLRGRPDDGGVTLASGDVGLRLATSAQEFSGPVVRLNGSLAVAELRGPGGYAARARITLAIRGTRATGWLTVAGAPS
jgi:sulfoxide reductase heme-binding subunit YedZ